MNRNALKGLTGTRKVGTALEADLYEGDETSVELTIRKTSGMNASHIRLNESCPLVSPDDAFRLTKLFIPSLPTESAVQFRYDITLDRRGLHEFPALDIASGAPFGMFQRKGTLSIPTRTLVYPEVRPLERMELLDRKLTAQIARPRAGLDTKFWVCVLIAQAIHRVIFTGAPSPKPTSSSARNLPTKPNPA